MVGITYQAAARRAVLRRAGVQRRRRGPRRVHPLLGARLSMIELEPGARFAAPAVRVDPAALQTVTLDHRSASRVAHVLRARDARAEWSVHCAKALLHELLQEQIERALDDGGEVAARIAMAQQIAGSIQLLLQ
jgi:hypothetical protein